MADVKEGFSLESFLKTLEDEPVEKTAEEKAAEEKAAVEAAAAEGKTVEEIAAEKVAAEKVAAEGTPAIEKTAEEIAAEKVVEEKTAEEKEKVGQLVEEGQIMARSFHEELEKLAVGDGPMTPNPPTIKDPNEVSHLSVGDIKLDQLAKVEALLNQIQAAVRSGGGDLAYTFNPGAPQPAGTIEESVLPHDVASAQKSQAAAANLNKAAADEIIDNLYKKVFGEE
jgi:hypothetical protein